jgi:hypothetical protein
MSYQVRERNLATLEDMQKCVLSFESNLLARRVDKEKKGESQSRKNHPLPL